MTQLLRERFMEKVRIGKKPNECWEWLASVRNSGYGRIKIGDLTRSAHRVSYELHVGKIPNGICVCHHCDNKLCVRPNHLFLGTHRDNARDMVQKGKHNPARGESAGSAKLTEKQVMKIRTTFKKNNRWGMKTVLARKYGISNAQITHILQGKHWRHV